MSPECLASALFQLILFHRARFRAIETIHYFDISRFICEHCHINEHLRIIRYSDNHLDRKPIEFVTIDGAMLLSRVRYVKIQNYQAGSIVIFNVYSTESGFSHVDMEELVNVNVLFNFYQATKLTIQNVAVRGWVLAPLASATNPTGVVWGSVFMQLLSGPLQVNIAPHPVCPSPPLPNPPVVPPICLPFGLERMFNIFVYGNYQASSDVQGRIAVSGNSVFSIMDSVPVIYCKVLMFQCR